MSICIIRDHIIMLRQNFIIANSLLSIFATKYILIFAPNCPDACYQLHEREKRRAYDHDERVREVERKGHLPAH